MTVTTSVANTAAERDCRPTDPTFRTDQVIYSRKNAQKAQKTLKACFHFLCLLGLFAAKTRRSFFCTALVESPPAAGRCSLGIAKNAVAAAVNALHPRIACRIHFVWPSKREHGDAANDVGAGRRVRGVTARGIRLLPSSAARLSEENRKQAKTEHGDAIGYLWLVIEPPTHRGGGGV